MKAVILAGGMGTRISEESILRPKPMIEIGGKPIIWHIMKIFAHYGISEFIICLGYKGYIIKEYFANFVLHHSDVTIDAANNTISYHQSTAEPWRITLVDTGLSTLTGGRLRRVRSFLPENEPFCFTYGDGVADINISELVDFHKASGTQATLTAVVPPGRYGAVELVDKHVQRFIEKPPGDGGYINGGFFVLDPSVIDLIEGDQVAWEGKPLETLALNRQVSAFRHRGFWQAMDTMRDRALLEELWQTDRAPWKVWT